MKDLDKHNMPVYIIILSLLLIFPLGVYYIVLKTLNTYRNMRKVSIILNVVGAISLLVGFIYFCLNYNIYVSLVDSHMSLDMYSFNFIWFYLYFLVLIISSFWGGLYLKSLCDKFRIYTEFINIRHIKELDLIMDETLEDLEVVKANIIKLIENGYLYNVKLVDNHLVSTKTGKKDSKKKYVKCKTCGNIELINNDKTRCSFCFRKLSKKDYI